MSRTPFEKALARDVRSPWEVAAPIFKLCGGLKGDDAKVAIAAVALVCRLVEAIENAAEDTHDAANALDKIEGKR